MFKHFASSIFMRLKGTNACGSDKGQMTRSELQDLFRSEFDMHNKSAIEITARHVNRRPQAYAA